jgi:hypothetical protein
MAKEEPTFLDVNDAFPPLDVPLISGETVRLPEATGEGYGIVLLYRGHW